MKVKCICLFCGKEFYTYLRYVKKGGGKYCSYKCYNVAKTGKLNLKARKGEYKKCLVCSKEFYVCKGHIKLGRGKYCSQKCMGKAKRNIKQSKERLQQQSELMVKYYASHRSKGKGKTFDTKIELAVEAELRSREIKYIKQYNAENVACVDFFIPEHKIIIQCDGNYWHSKKEQQRKDINQDFVLRFKGYKIFRFWESEINKNVKKCVDKVKSKVEELNGI